jgi:hypothetical protein
MVNIDFSFTADGSVGIYDRITKDIFHSITGAKQESFDKFILATDFQNFAIENTNINLLDICFGIGYNTKSAINVILQSNSVLNITALELSKEIAFLSPFIIDKFENPEIDLFLLAYFLSEFSEYTDFISSYFSQNSDIKNSFFDKNLCRVFQVFVQSRYENTCLNDIYLFLHNIYYQNISNSMKKSSKPFNINKINFKIIFDDARKSIQKLSSSYDFIFLDAFTPHKQPLLWSYEFFTEIKSRMTCHSIISTYSNATPIRKTLSELGFIVGKILIDDKQFGTVASFDKSKIKNNLSEYDIGLMNTKAGIPYRDTSLNSTSLEILKNRELELKNCDIMSATEYKRIYENAKL